MRFCAAADCENIHYASGWCRQHYLRVLRYNSLNAPIKEKLICKVIDCEKTCGPSGLCKIHYDREHRKLITPEQDHAHHLKYRYGVTIEQYNKMFEYQNGKCAICGNAETRTFKNKIVKLAIDHCHETGKVRKLLCFRCNSVLGKLNDNVELLDAMKAYLKCRL